MPNDDVDFGFEETKSTILDYFLMFQEVKWAVITTIGTSIALILLVIGLFSIILNANLDSLEANQIGFLVFGLGIILVLSLLLPVYNGDLFFKTITKGRRQQRELLAIQSNLIRRSYLMNFELVEPEIIIREGDSKLERIMNHLSLVFPEVSRINKKRIGKEMSAEQYAKKFKRKMHFLRNYDLGIKTSTGWFVVQFFDKVKFSDIEEIVRKFSFDKAVGANIQRIIIVGKVFDSSFEKEKLEEKMNEFKRKEHVDIILEDQFGYSTVWID